MRKEELMKKIEDEIKKCKKCSLWRNRRNSVPGEGNVNSKIMLIGLGPGKEEDRYGRPFVGPAGKFLNELLEIVGIKRENVYITNIVKCIPPNNKPTEEQIKICTSLYLKNQIKIVSPKLIIALGEIATKWIFQNFNLKYSSMKKLHGKIFHVNTIFGKIFIIPMFHPASALYNPKLRKEIINDWVRIRDFIKSL